MCTGLAQVIRGKSCRALVPCLVESLTKLLASFILANSVRDLGLFYWVLDTCRCKGYRGMWRLPSWPRWFISLCIFLCVLPSLIVQLLHLHFDKALGQTQV